MRLKLISDGTIGGTKVVDARTGELVDNVVSVSFVASVDHEPVAVIRLHIPEIEVTTDALAFDVQEDHDAVHPKI